MVRQESSIIFALHAAEPLRIPDALLCSAPFLPETKCHLGPLWLRSHTRPVLSVAMQSHISQLPQTPIVQSVSYAGEQAFYKLTQSPTSDWFLKTSYSPPIFLW